MPLLRMREARFTSPAVTAGPVTLDLEIGEHAALELTSAREATIVALLASGIVKASSGCVLIGDYDPRVQSVACKRIAGFVPHEPFALDDHEFARYVGYRAALWNVDPQQARQHAERLRVRLAGMHETLAYPLIGALIGRPKLVVLDRPQAAYAAQIIALVGKRALVSTHADAASARAFAPGPRGLRRASPA